MNRSVRDTDGGILAVSQFTLYASTKKGHRPSWSAAARPEIAQPVFDALVAALTAELGKPVPRRADRKSTRLNSSHLVISYAVFCLKKKKQTKMVALARMKAISTR